MKSPIIDRRRLILGLVALSGGSLSPATVKILDNALSAEETAPAHILTAAQHHAVSIISEIIIPETDTPGANAAGVPDFVDHALGAWLTRAEAAAIIDGLSSLMLDHTEFTNTDAAAQTAIVEKLDQDLSNDTLYGGFYRPLKEIILIGYYTSEIGASEELAYDPVPGGYYEIKLNPEDKSWST